jgi:hypothetical protein
MLAQTPPDAIQFMGWLGCLLFFLGIVRMLLWFVDRFKGKPANEQLAGEAGALAHRVSKLEADHQKSLERRQKMHEKIEGFDRSIREDIKDDLEKIYDEINKLRTGQAQLGTNDQHQNQHLVHIEAKLDRLIERKAH